MRILKVHILFPTYSCLRFCLHLLPLPYLSTCLKVFMSQIFSIRSRCHQPAINPDTIPRDQMHGSQQANEGQGRQLMFRFRPGIFRWVFPTETESIGRFLLGQFLLQAVVDHFLGGQAKCWQGYESTDWQKKTQIHQNTLEFSCCHFLSEL